MQLQATCRALKPFRSLAALRTILSTQPPGELCVLGSGSNVILPHYYDGVVLLNQMRGIYMVSSNQQFVDIEVAGGENWHDFVSWSVNSGYFGLENLALIPGTVGAAPVQNIGAYGVEMADFMLSCRVWDSYQKRVKILEKADCEFAYRTSVFKTHAKGRYIILAVRFRLQRQPQCCVVYPRLQAYLASVNQPITPRSVMAAVVAIRSQRLPDWRSMGTAGSFFTNPIVSKQQADRLKRQCPELVTIALSDNTVKVFAGDLLRLAGWRAYCEDCIMTSSVNPLVLLHKGGATRAKLYRFVQKLTASVYRQFGIMLTVEPEIFPDVDHWCNQS